MTDPRLDVAQTIHDFIFHLDEGAYERVAELFTADGVWIRGGTPCTGPAGVLAVLRQRPATLRTRHLASNMVVRIAGDGAAHARYYLTVYDGESADGGPATIALPHAMFVCADDLVPSGQEWRFIRRQPRMVFKR